MRPPMLAEAIQDEATRPPMLVEDIQDEAARPTKLDEASRMVEVPEVMQ